MGFNGGEQLTAELMVQSVEGANVEAPTAAMFSELVARLPDSPSLQKLVTNAAQNMVRRQVRVGAAVSGLRTALTHYFTSEATESNRRAFSDAKLTAPIDWQTQFEILEADMLGVDSVTSRPKKRSNAASYMLGAGIVFLDAVTPVLDRNLILEVDAQVIAERCPDGARVLDYGSSTMLGSLYVMNKDLCRPVTFRSASYQAQDRDPPIDLTNKINEFKNRSQPIKEIVCVDRVPVYDEARGRYDKELANYALSGLRPSERNDPGYVQELKKLMSTKERGNLGYRPNSGVTFHWGNFLNPKDLGEFKDQFPEPFDIVIMNFVTQELAPPDQVLLHSIATGLLQENGILIYNHQAYIAAPAVQPAQFSEVKFLESYASTPWSSQSHVQDNLQPVRGLQHMASFADNRCRDVRLGRGEFMINGVSEPIGELIRYA